MTCILLLLVLWPHALDVQAANILLLPDPIKSHLAIFNALSDELVKRGHTIYTLLNEKVNVPEKMKSAGKSVVTYASNRAENEFEVLMDNITQVALSNHGSVRALYAEVNLAVLEEMDTLLLNKHNLDIPSNVYISDWLPQNDLLGHPGVQVFVTHCGNNGQFEALYHGVPFVSRRPVYVHHGGHRGRVL